MYLFNVDGRVFPLVFPRKNSGPGAGDSWASPKPASSVPLRWFSFLSLLSFVEHRRYCAWMAGAVLFLTPIVFGGVICKVG